MKIQLPSIVLTALIAVSAINANAAVDPIALMNDVIYRHEGLSQISFLALSTCSYIIKDNKLSCSSTPRKKLLQSVAKNYGDQLRDVKAFTLIVEPVAEAGIGILQYDYYEKGKDADQWLYLPEVGSVKRVASSQDAPKSGSLFGSEFALEDLEKTKLENFDIKFREETTLNDRKVVVIEEKPREAYAKKTNYSKRVFWVDPERLLILKTEFYGWNSQLIKTNELGDVVKVSDIWIGKKNIMNNVQNNRISIMVMSDVKFNQPVEDEMFTQRILNDAVFQKSKLKSLDFLSQN